jgi:YidC/Oxa1 family membrane protein insertase
MAMNKKDAIPFGILLVLLVAWPYLDRFVAKKFFPNHTPAQPASVAPAAGPVASELTASPSESTSEPVAAPVTIAPAVRATDEEVATEEQPPARSFLLANDLVEIELSSRGGTVTRATLKEFPRVLGATDPVVLDFERQPALAYENLKGLGDGFDFAPGASSASSMVFERVNEQGLRLRRTMTLNERYVVSVVDELVNESGVEIALPGHRVRTGPMRREAGHKDSAGVVTLGVDSLSPGGQKVQHWGGRIAKMFTTDMEERGSAGLPLAISEAPHDQPVDWVAAKNKYFAQIVTPEGGAEGLRVLAWRATSPREAVDASAVPTKMTEIAEVAVAAVFAEQSLAPGEKVERRFTYYVGPKKYSELFAMRLHQVDVMEFGDWIKPISKLLLKVLNGIHSVIPNYGIAIILLTIIVRVVFWPVTHKSTESMKRMAQVAPLVNQLREKYKDNPTKQQQEIMALYKEHKVNPLGGCLPMLIQIPVFFALFTVLRSAIELRFADFLWIRDLSEPENLFQGMIPLVGSLNLLPLLMSFTMWLQMKLSPSAGDPAQQKIMAVMMPIMMLFFLYSFASGLALYWTTQNVLMIIQQVMMKSKNAATPAKA